jgi:hypothetical protein
MLLVMALVTTAMTGPLITLFVGRSARLAAAARVEAPSPAKS